MKEQETKMKTEFTKGEWKVEHEFNVVSDNGRTVASAGGYSSNVNPAEVHSENVANAKLIAAAKDLFAALTQLLKCSTQYKEMHGSEKCEAYLQGEAALKKATE